MLQLPDTYDLAPSRAAPGAMLSDPDAIILLFAGHALVQRSDGPPALTAGDYGSLLNAWTTCESVGRYRGRPCLAVSLPNPPPSLPPGWEAQGLRQWFGRLPDDLTSIAMQASQLLEWVRTHRWCGACGVPTVRVPGERAMQCPRCGLRNSPRISPAMMVLVTRGHELLLASNVNFPPGRYSALAGFLEAGESVEAAIHREVAEEVGIQVHRPRYFGSQSWPFPHSLMIAFTAEWLAGDIHVDPTEIRDARWFTPDTLPDLPPANVSISRALVEHVAHQLRQGRSR